MDDHKRVLIPGTRVPRANAVPSLPVLGRTRGSTLVELTFTLGITTVILLTLYGFMMTQAMVSLEENTELSTQNSIRQGAQQLIDELEMCRPRRLDSMGAWFEYYLPQTAPNGGYVLDSNGNLIFGVMDGNTWYLNGFYCVTFIRSNEPNDYLNEATLTLNGATSPGTDLNGNGTMTDVFIGGTLMITAFDVNGNPIGQPRGLTGKFFMQLNPTLVTNTAPVTNPALNYTNADSMNMSVFPLQGVGDPSVATQLGIDRMQYKGTGIFLIRQTNGIGAQKADTFVDTNGDGILDGAEQYTDTNANGVYDEWDSEPFTDTNGNNIKDPLEAYVDANHNGKYDCRMTLQLVTFKPGRAVSESGLDRDKSVGLKVSITKIRFKNLP